MTDIYFVKSDIHFTKTEKKLIEYIIASPQEFIRMSIGDIARRIGAKSPRAVGVAIGHNPISIIIPCHRVVGANGDMTGYAGGVQTKIKLLTHEGAL